MTFMFLAFGSEHVLCWLCSQQLKQIKNKAKVLSHLFFGVFSPLCQATKAYSATGTCIMSAQTLLVVTSWPVSLRPEVK